MKPGARWLAACWFVMGNLIGWSATEPNPSVDSKPDHAPSSRDGRGHKAHYWLERETTKAKSTVTTLNLWLGPTPSEPGQSNQWFEFEATKAGGEQFRAWVLSVGYPPPTLGGAKKSIERYILQEGPSRAAEFRDRFTHRPVLPTLGGWINLFPRPDDKTGGGFEKSLPSAVSYLGHRYTLEDLEESPMPLPPEGRRVIELLPDVLVGAASNTRQKEDGRHYDNSDYPLVRLTRADYREMFEAGFNCFKVNAEQLPWVEELDAFYWGVSGLDVPYPESLYRSTYLGPTLFLDEPAVCTRDYVIRPRLSKEPGFRKSLSPELVLDAFKTYFRQALETGAPESLLESLRANTNIDLGDMKFRQENLFSWETMVSTAAHQLSQDPDVPSAMVFEPPGRVGALRTLPEMDMTYGCQLAVGDPKNLTAVIYGFLRGGARLTGKTWGTSIYGSVDRADAFWFLTQAYDLGATRFFFWDNGPQSCVPYRECLALAGSLWAHTVNYPDRNLPKLTAGAEVAVLLPPGYNLGHVQMGKGNLWGLAELNLERTNHVGVKYRAVMSNFFAEIERCIRLGVEFDLLWDLPDRQPSGYREIVHVRDDGKVGISGPDGEQLLSQARIPPRPKGDPPSLRVELSADQGKAPLRVQARAEITETTARVWYTHGTDRQGVCRNAYAFWELYGPNEEDYRVLIPEGFRPEIEGRANHVEVTTSFALKQPGTYRLRVATADVAGRSTVQWKSIAVSE